MPEGEKPYRVYRGGRVRGRVPTLPKPERAPSRDGRRPPRLRYPGPGPRRETERRPNWRRRILLVLGALFLLLIVWIVMSYLALRSGTKDANARLSPAAGAALEPQDGLILSQPSVFLLVGTDHAAYQRQRRGFRRADSLMLVRTDPGRGRVSYLSIPRDLRVEVPGYGFEKINSAMQLGGAPLTIRTVRGLPQLPEVNHVVIVNFDAFKEVIDKVGGVTIDVPGPILANKFDCPYATQARCDQWAGWRFAKGKQEMDGRRALVYSRIRENKLNPRESDFTRGERQQAVIQALLSKLTSVGVFVKLPFIGDDIMRPLTTDLTAGQLIQLALVKKRSGRELHCRLGGEPQNFGGGSFIQLDEEARRTVLAFLGKSAPQPPLPGATFGSGCPAR
ncbi:MAG TPA: LCP family protein [Gaiellaceae bacterium]|nr:LCP family protein [Gaiellaceae bacterium]